jgi:hypothetical protein
VDAEIASGKSALPPSLHFKKTGLSGIKSRHNPGTSSTDDNCGVRMRTGLLVSLGLVPMRVAVARAPMVIGTSPLQNQLRTRLSSTKVRRQRLPYKSHTLLLELSEMLQARFPALLSSRQRRPARWQRRVASWKGRRARPRARCSGAGPAKRATTTTAQTRRRCRADADAEATRPANGPC